MRRLAVVFVAFAAAGTSCGRQPDQSEPAIQPAVPPPTTDTVLRRVLATPGFEWTIIETPHARLHMPIGGAIVARFDEISDSITVARAAALAILGEPDAGDPRKPALVLVDTRDEMKALVGRPVGGWAIPDEMSALFVAGPGYRPAFRHELMHLYVVARWGPMRSGAWLNEGLATLATGTCMGHTVDAIAAGYRRAGAIPPIADLAANVYGFPELPGYFGSASLADFIRRERGLPVLRAIWRGEQPGVDPTRPLGHDTAAIEAAWHRHLDGVKPATLDVARLHRDGC